MPLTCALFFLVIDLIQLTLLFHFMGFQQIEVSNGAAQYQEQILTLQNIPSM